MANCKHCGVELSDGRRKFCSDKHKDQYHNIHNPRGNFDRVVPKPGPYTVIIEDDIDKWLDWYYSDKV